ncbi:MAG: hypothetical protein KDC07_11050, partial [Chitinophagaceae bacterium]|nr:hypothetical protein [Chitinophagaceae bacterium]
ADMVYMPLKFELTTPTPVCYEWETISFNLRITNTDKDSTWPVMIPGPTNDGRKLLYMSVYTVDTNNHYTEVTTEITNDVTSPSPTGGNTGNVRIVQLKPGTHVDIPFRLHSQPHYLQASADRHWFSQPLMAGVYKFLVWYQPYGIAPFDLYHYMYWPKSEASATKLNFYVRGTQSNYCEVEIIKRNPEDLKTGIAEHCGKDCRFCNHIKAGKWNRVRHDIDQTLQVMVERPDHIDKTIEDVSWLKKHKEVAYLQPPPEMIILPFPAHWSQKIGFRSADTVLYFNMTFQAGKIYKGRSRMQAMIFALFGGHEPLLKTSDQDYVGLSYFEPAR